MDMHTKDQRMQHACQGDNDHRWFVLWYVHTQVPYINITYYRRLGIVYFMIVFAIMLYFCGWQQKMSILFDLSKKSLHNSHAFMGSMFHIIYKLDSYEKIRYKMMKVLSVDNLITRKVEGSLCRQLDHKKLFLWSSHLQREPSSFYEIRYSPICLPQIP